MDTPFWTPKTKINEPYNVHKNILIEEILQVVMRISWR
jgi:hypothetical protein